LCKRRAYAAPERESFRGKSFWTPSALAHPLVALCRRFMDLVQKERSEYARRCDQ
jgi:hypothetical protein